MEDTIDATDDTVSPTTPGPTVSNQDTGIIGANPTLDSGDVALIDIVGLLVVLGDCSLVDGAT